MIYKNVLIATHKEEYLGYVEVDDKSGKILSIKKGKTAKEGIDCSNKILMPAFIDTHTHGGYGLDFTCVDDEDFEKKWSVYEKELVKEGVAGVFGASVTVSFDKLKILTNVYEQIINKYPDTLLGWYMEGPFISIAKKGAHDPLLIKPATDEILNWIKEHYSHHLSIVIAPEENDSELLKKYQNVFEFSVGHSNAYNLSSDGTINLFSRVTHLYNACSGFNHRDDSIVNTILTHKPLPNDFSVEIIADGMHTSNKVLEHTWKNIDLNNLTIVSDSLPQKGLPNGYYILGSLENEKRGDLFYLKGTNTISGSGKPYNRIVDNFKQATKATWSQIVHYTSYNVAKKYNLLNKYGSLRVNVKANFIVFDEHVNIETFYKNGKLVYQK
ncbi:N-acetylglucosamine-6-phosphate deacetylase [Mycoplasmopsis californica]|uniref:Amidohydrolase family protein n=1 Tax=Mycoplasmopsis equigenitalium TaxID=114883 RepID=A0ABY5J2S8_9BACT|nr:amidohydrolase family protein [Mycoplasmopsis equigenitalium]UUD37029.1 amidohydrolase family protein [Mycoplasmopsis equigenitalium]VEU69672.1 N-acetylglucosamine-6-phosphate deacetylase [Mycoplasmopsis californica]